MDLDQRCQSIELILSDVDGVLTDGRLVIDKLLIQAIRSATLQSCLDFLETALTFLFRVTSKDKLAAATAEWFQNTSTFQFSKKIPQSGGRCHEPDPGCVKMMLLPECFRDVFVSAVADGLS